MPYEGLIRIGYIKRAHGIHGELVVMPLTEDPGRYGQLHQVYVRPQQPLSGMAADPLNIQSYRFAGKDIILKFREINDRNTAESYKGWYIEISRDDLRVLPADTYYVFDMIGLDVYSEEGEFLGKLKDISSTGSNDVYEVGKEGAKSFFIPALKSVVRQISLESGKIIVRIPEGLLDDQI